jgi:hypothetical protein
MEEIKVKALENAVKEKVHYSAENGLMVLPKTDEEVIASAKIMEDYLRGVGFKVKVTLCGEKHGVVCSKDRCCKINK